MQDPNEGDLDDNTFLVAKSIYSYNIQPPNFYKLGLEDDETLDIAEKQGFDSYVQGLLTIITMHGVEILYGHKDITKLTQTQIDTIKSYTRSYGYNLQTDGGIKFVAI